MMTIIVPSWIVLLMAAFSGISAALGVYDIWLKRKLIKSKESKPT